MFFTSAFWKRQARAALKNHWLTALLIALVVSLPSLLVQGMTHQLSHQLLHADCYHIIVSDSSSRNLPKGQWVKRDELENFAMPKLLLRILEKVFSEIYSE